MSTTGMHTETTLKARHKEALDIFEAWCDRVQTSGGHDRVAAELQQMEAWDWVEQTAEDLRLYREVMRSNATAARRSASNTRGRLHAHRTH
ncbi:hypothetical protein FBY30_2775 [Arthrobacter sp. SLBN-83]|uniref:hypothetical protein n=1 Tax=Arthrobacter sp. SLBN-83 TaxID=2768449 RepID=UPI0011535458|nr:hypothetical protein [Arthrobacter sp. SLBN-83]TQJ60507.1 hypothetical protein FBY30_2775 [Arthrobacter sp. SLBN-83]